jgi:hypothetical protein
MEDALTEERRFLVALFDELQPMVDALVEDAEAEYGHEFDRADVKWHEATPNGSPLQVCSLVWKDIELLQVQLSTLGSQASVSTEWSRLTH